MVEPRPDCVVLGAVDVGHGGEGVVVLGHGDGLVRPVAGYRVDCSLSDSGLPVGAAAASMLWRIRSRLLAPPGTGWLQYKGWIVGFTCFLAGKR